MTENLTIAQIKVLGRSPDDAKARGLKMLERVGLMAHKDKFRASFQAVSSSASPSRGRCPWTPS